MWRIMFRLAIPSIIGFFLFGLNNLLDLIFVGFFIGKEGIAALTLAYPIVQMLSGMGLLVGMGGASLLSLAIGKGDEGSMKQIYSNTFLAAVLLGALVSVTGYFLSAQLISIMGGSGEAGIQGANYLRIIFLGAVFNIVSAAMNLLLRGEGRMITAMILFGIATVIHSILTPLFIKYFGWGIEGAAWASNISFFLSCVLHFSYFYIKKRELCTRKLFQINFHVTGRIFKLGLPSTLLNFLILIQHYFIINQLVKIGENESMIFFGALNRILMFSMLPVYGMSRALQPIIGITFASGEYEKTKKAFRVFSISGTIGMAVIVAAMLVFSKQIMAFILPGIFVTKEEALFYNLMMLSLILMPLLIFLMTIFQATGKIIISLLLVLSRQVVLFVPLLFLLISIYGIAGIYYSFVTIDLCVLLLGMIFLSLFFKRVANSDQEQVAGKIETLHEGHEKV